MTINYLNNQLSITSCEDFVIVISINLINSRVDRVIRIKAVIRLASNAMIEVSIQIREKDNLSSKRDYLFQSATSIELESEDDVFTHVIDTNINFVQIRNATTESVVLSKYVKLERIQDYKEENCYLAASENMHLVAKLRKTFKNLFRLALIVVMRDIIALTSIIYQTFNNFIIFTFDSVTCYHINSNNLTISTFDCQATNSSTMFTSNSMTNYYFDVVSTTFKDMKSITHRDITIYNDSKIRRRLEQITNVYFNL